MYLLKLLKRRKRHTRPFHSGRKAGQRHASRRFFRCGPGVCPGCRKLRIVRDDGNQPYPGGVDDFIEVAVTALCTERRAVKPVDNEPLLNNPCLLEAQTRLRGVCLL